jgi:hypothetical protein
MTQGMSSEELGNCWSLITCIKKQASAAPFLNPVSASLVPDYYDVIKAPTDLSTITLNLSKGVYDSSAALIDELNLLFQNCFQYNPTGSPVFNEGKKLYSYTQNQLMELFPDLKLKNARRLSVEASIVDLQTSLTFIKNQLDSLSQNIFKSPKRSSVNNYPMASSPLSQESMDTQLIKAENEMMIDGSSSSKQSQKRNSVSSENTSKQERIKMLRAAPIHEGYACEYCKDTHTPMWRSGPSGPRTLCNKCGVKWRAGRILKDRPPPVSTRSPAVKGAPKQLPKPKKRVITLAQKLAMANAISNPNIDEDVLIHVVETIRASLPGLQKNEEVEIDMDKLGNATLVKLYDYLHDEGILSAV